MINVPITIIERNGISRQAEPVTMGLPFAKGQLLHLNNLCLYDSDTLLPCQTKKTASWHDGSIKWILLDFQLDLDKNTEKTLVLKNQNKTQDSDLQAVLPAIKIEESEKDIVINTGYISFVLDKSELKPFAEIIQNGERLLDQNQCELILKDKNNQVLKALIKTIKLEPIRENVLRTTILIQGEFVAAKGDFFANFETELTFYAGKSTVKWDFTLHNPKAAKHSGGLWDLGDPGSIYFKQLMSSFGVTTPDSIQWKTAALSQWQQQSDNVLIYQDSSGGKIWNSQNHINKEGKLSVKFKGYQCYESDRMIQSGDRIAPFIHVNTSRLSLTVYIKQFWQNFPKSLGFGNNKLTLSLFPEQFNDVFELQGGEKKTHTIFLDCSENKNNLDYCEYPLIPQIPTSFYSKSNVFPLLTIENETNSLEALIQAGLEGDNNFFAKREIIDEYGWRNFGELFADHESHYKKNNEINISHYNNQYDPIYGFLQEFVLTGNHKWFELMTDLTRHVIDIDIYHTNDDRHEYNNSLLWHTNHYVDAATCTHRTYSQAHLEDEPDAGGGPGDEHCYTNGLANYYFMTGCLQAKKAVLSLADWSIKLHEGNGGLLERLLLFKQAELPVLKALKRGEVLAKHKYPFTRGTGYYISTLLDAYSVSLNYSYIIKVESIIRQTIHPNDDIESRNLDDIEVTWFYTILLQAIIKYLYAKIELNEMDPGFFYARDCLIHYTDWMLENETPYLDRAEVLEFPNHTWVAQDLRKAYIFSIAACFNPTNKEAYKEKSEFFLSYVVENLEKHKTRTYTRILVILMQNQFNKQFNFAPEVEEKMTSNQSMFKDEKVPVYTVKALLTQFASELLNCLRNLSIKKERTWIKLRLGH